MKKSIFIIAIILCVKILFANSITDATLWDDDLQFINTRLEELKKMHGDSQYTPYMGKSDVVVFFEDKAFVTYVYPDSSAKLKVKDKKGTDKYLEVVLPSDEYTGLGIMAQNPVSLVNSKKIGSGYLNFYIKLESEISDLRIALVQKEKPRIEAFLELSDFVDAKNKDWQEVKIPLDKFPTVGSCWDMEYEESIEGYLDFNDVVEVKFFYPDQKRYVTNFELDNIKIKDDGTVVERKITFLPVYRESLDSLFYFYTYPSKGTVLKESRREKVTGKKSLEMSFNPSEYSGVALSKSLIDLGKDINSLALEFYVKLKTGKEFVSISLVNDFGTDEKKLKSKLLLNKYCEGNTEWQKVIIPIKDFPDVGSCYDMQEKKEVKGDFKYDMVSEIIFEAKKSKLKKCIIYVDDIRFRYLR